MNINNLFFHIHYCNGKKIMKSRKLLTRITQHHVLIFVTEGKGSMIIGDKRYPIKRGMLFYSCPDVLHSFEPDAKEPSSFLTVHFSYARVFFNDGIWDIKQEAKMLSLNPGQELKDYYHVEDIFSKLADHWNTKLPGYEFITKTLLQELLIAIYQNIRKQNRNYSTSLKVERIIQYMHQNINNRISLPELSEMAQISPAYLSRSFKEITGYSVIEYFNKIKIDKAKELIIEGNKKVKEIAQILGFTDEFYFSRIFKRVEGVSPSEYYSKNVHGV